tara:strand:- start:1451 stop:1810 length:360 start_codon:yes stop_codon:yes gene_type:complete
MEIVLQRIYAETTENEGTRILVDRIWPRGISKEQARLDHWWKEFAPGTELRKWFNHDEAKWQEFKKRYLVELQSKKKVIASLLEDLDFSKKLILLYGAKDENHNQAVVLKEYILNYYSK